MEVKVRRSNMELLRIIAMIFIMLGHSYVRLVHNGQEGVFGGSLFWRSLMSAIVTSGVGVFIAISGWFGIRFKLQSLAKYLFLVYFILFFLYGIAIVFNITNLSIQGVLISLGFADGYWFVLGYLGLFLISPLLNMFIEHASKKDFQILLLSYFVFQSYVSWLSGWYNYYDGYSIIMFAGIYLSAAYVRKYPIKWIEQRASILWIITILAIAVIATLSMWKFGHAGRQIRDDNPLIIFAGILMLLSFKKLTFHSKIVNWLAASSFAVYLIHYSPFVYPYFMKGMRYLYYHFDGMIYGVTLLIALLIVFFVCTLFDQLRIFCWKIVQPLFDSKKV